MKKTVAITCMLALSGCSGNDIEVVSPLSNQTNSSTTVVVESDTTATADSETTTATNSDTPENADTETTSVTSTDTPQTPNPVTTAGTNSDTTATEDSNITTATSSQVTQPVDTNPIVPADPNAVFVTADRVNFQNTAFAGVQQAQAFSNPNTGAHETFIRVAAGAAIPPHTYPQATWSMVINGSLQIPAPIDEMNPMSMENGSASFIPAWTEHQTDCLGDSANGDSCLYLIHQDGAFDITATGNTPVDSRTAPRNASAAERPFSSTMGWRDVDLPGSDFRNIVGNYFWHDGTQHGTLVRMQGGTSISTHFHTRQARGYVLRGEMEVPAPYNQTNPELLRPGAYFAVPAMVVHQLNCVSESICLYYFRQDGDFDYTPVNVRR